MEKGCQIRETVDCEHNKTAKVVQCEVCRREDGCVVQIRCCFLLLHKELSKTALFITVDWRKETILSCQRKQKSMWSGVNVYARLCMQSEEIFVCKLEFWWYWSEINASYKKMTTYQGKKYICQNIQYHTL